MRNILGHKSWNEQEVLAFFDKGTFTMCSLPHYRYQPVREICSKLQRCGLIAKVGRTETGINFVAKPTYHQWRLEAAEGKAPSNLRKLYTYLNPPILLDRTCVHCQIRYETFDRQQKYCSANCKKMDKPSLRSRLQAAKNKKSS